MTDALSGTGLGALDVSGSSAIWALRRMCASDRNTEGEPQRQHHGHHGRHNPHSDSSTDRDFPHGDFFFPFSLLITDLYLRIVTVAESLVEAPPFPLTPAAKANNRLAPPPTAAENV